MRIPIILIQLCLFLTSGLCASARADLLRILDRVPEDAMAALVIPNLRTFNDNTTQLIGAMELTSSNLEQVLGVVGIRDAIDFNASAAAIMWPFADNADAYHDWIVLLPTVNADALPAALRAEPGDSPRRFDFNRDTLYIKPVNDRIAAISPDRDRLAAFGDDTSHLEFRRSLIGASIESLDDSDAFLLANIAQSEHLFELVRAAANGRLAAVPMTTEPGLLREVARFVEHNADLLQRDGSAAVISASFSALGMRLDLVSSFRPDSEFGRQLDLTPINSAAPLAGIPEAPFVAAAWLRMDQQILRLMSPDRPDDNEEVIDYARMLDGADAVSVAILAPKSIAQAVIARTIIHWTGDDPMQVARRFRASLEALEDPMKATYAPASVAPMNADAWTIQLPVASRPSAVWYFGAGAALKGPSGLIHTRRNDGFATLTRKPDLLVSAIEATDGHGQRLTDNVIVGQLLSLLPANPDALALVSVEPLMPQVAPMIEAQLGTTLRIPPQLPPIGAVLVARNHATHASIYVPTPDLRLLLDLYRAWDAARSTTVP